MFHTRQQILTKYGLNIAAFNFIMGTQQLSGDFVDADGKRVIDITPEDDLVLRSARNSIYCFGSGTYSKGKLRGVRALPFHRFLCLRFLTIPVFEAYEEIFQLGLLRAKSVFTLAHMKRMHDRFIALCPEEIIGDIKELRVPENKEAFKAFMSAIDVVNLYSNPAIVEDLSTFLGVRVPLEVMLTTTAGSAEVREAMDRKMNVTARTAMDIVAYRRVFYDIHSLACDDVEAYLYLLPPSERALKKGAQGKDLPALAISSGAADMADRADILEYIMNQALQEYQMVARVRTSQAAQMSRAALDRFVKANEMLGAASPARIADKTREMVIHEVPPDEKLISMEEVRKRKSGSAS